MILIHSDLVMSFREAMAKAGAGAGHRCGFQRALAKAVGAAAVDLGYLALSKAVGFSQDFFQDSLLL